MDVALFDYELPPELIAQYPPEKRGDSRMLVLSRQDGHVEHRMFRELPMYLRQGDCLVINDTRVIPARLQGRRPTGGKIELLLLRALGDSRWEALARPARRFRAGAVYEFGDGELRAEVVEVLTEGRVAVQLTTQDDVMATLERVGAMPLPPYIRHGLAEEADRERYQTVFAREPGAVAAPTAGLHFDEAMLAAVEGLGVTVARVTLHVGRGTFRPVEADRVEDHVMHEEYYEIGQQAADAINAARSDGGRVVAVGTTSVRALETAADEDGMVHATQGWSAIYITPGYRFRCVDALLTNFHLPRSTLLMLVSALAGREQVLAAYAKAVRERYRFYSYGDCMLIQ